MIVTRVCTSRSEGFEYDDDDGVRVTQFDGYIPVFTGIHYGYDTRMIPTEDITDPLLRPLTTLGTRRFEFFLISLTSSYNMEEIAGSNAYRERKTPRGSPAPMNAGPGSRVLRYAREVRIILRV